MNLQQLAEADLSATLEGDGQPVTLTAPDGVSAEFQALSTDIALTIDPETGTMVSGRTASAVFRISSLTAAGFSLPRGVPNTAVKPWLVTFNDVNGGTHTFKVDQSEPDRAMGVVVCMLEAWR